MEKMTLTVAEAAQALQLSKPTVYALCQRPDFPAVRVGKKVLIPIDRLQEWLRSESSMEKNDGKEA